jgi:hypothetical protein
MIKGLITSISALISGKDKHTKTVVIDGKEYTLSFLDNDHPNKPFFYYAQTSFEGQVGQKGNFDHWFGHTGTFKIVNPPSKGKLHQVLELDLKDPAFSFIKCGLDKLPLLYCFQFEDGCLEYDILPDRKIRITKLDEDSYDREWPYEGYPKRFKKIPLKISDPNETTIEEFRTKVWQGITPEESAKFIAVVPPSSLYNFNLWEEDSNFDHIHVKFFFDPNTNSVKVSNACD